MDRLDARPRDDGPDARAAGRARPPAALRPVVGAILATVAAVSPVCGDPRAAIPGDGTDALGVRAGASETLVASLRARILASHSATRALEGWCAEYGLALDARLVALRLPVAERAPSAAQRARLAVGPDEPVRHRRVRLACGDRVLSEADNWYVPARLSPAMNAALDGTRAPFGQVVRPLEPVRRTLAVRAFAAPPEPGPDDPLFAVEALLVTGAGEPFCEVAETYLGGALPAAR